MEGHERFVEGEEPSLDIQSYFLDEIGIGLPHLRDNHSGEVPGERDTHDENRVLSSLVNSHYTRDLDI